MDILDQAIYDTVHKSDVRASEIATRLGMNHQVLLNKANPQNESHKMSVRESLAIQLLTGNHRIQSALDTLLNAESLQTPFQCVFQAMLATSKEQGDVARVIQEAMSDGRFTMREKEDAFREIDEVIESLELLKLTIAEHKSENLKAVS